MSEQSSYRFEFDGQHFELLLPAAQADAAAEAVLGAVPGVLRSLQAYLGAGDLVLDWGAQVGAYAVPLAVATQVRVAAFEADSALRQLLSENAQRNHASQVSVHDAASLEQVGLDGPPRLVRLDGDAAASASLRELSRIIAEHRPLVCVCSGLQRGPQGAEWLRGSGYIPFAHLGPAAAVLYAHTESRPRDVSFQIMTAVDALASLIETRTAGLFRGAEGAGQVHELEGAITALRVAFEGHARQTRALLDEQLVHSRRVDAELFDLARRYRASGEAEGEEAPRGGNGGSAVPTAMRKLRKLMRDPRAFVEDSRSGVVRRLGKKVVK